MKNKVLSFSLIVVAVSILLFLMFSYGYVPLSAIQAENFATRAENIGNNDLLSEEAANLLSKAKELSPNYCGVRFYLGRYYYDQAFFNRRESTKIGESYDHANAEKAIAEFQEVIKGCRGSNFENLSLMYLARTYYWSGNLTTAISVLDELIANLPEKNSILSPVYDLRADAYHQLNDRENELISLILTMYNESEMEDQGDNILRIQNILKESSYLVEEVLPTRPLGFGKYTSATITSDGMMQLFAISNDGISLGRYQKREERWQLVDYLLVDETILGNVSIDQDQNTHVVFASGNQLYYSSNVTEIVNTILPVNLNDYSLMSQLSNNLVSTRLSSLQMTLDDLNIPHLVWGHVDMGVFYSTVSDGALTGTSLILPYGTNPDIKVEGEHVYVVCNTFSSAGVFPSSQTQLLFREKIGSVWQPIVKLSNSEIWSGGASMEISPDGTIHVVYIAGASVEDAHLMYVFRNPQGIWSIPEVIANGEIRPWIPDNYGGKYTAATTMMEDGSLTVIWRAPLNNDMTAVLGRQLVMGQWMTVTVIDSIEGKDYYESPSIVETANLPKDIIKLLWFDYGEPIIKEWKP